MRLPAPEARANISSSSSESDICSSLPSQAQQGERRERGVGRGSVPIHVGICRNCRRLYRRSGVSTSSVLLNITHYCVQGRSEDWRLRQDMEQVYRWVHTIVQVIMCSRCTGGCTQ